MDIFLLFSSINEMQHVLFLDRESLVPILPIIWQEITCGSDVITKWRHNEFCGAWYGGKVSRWAIQWSATIAYSGTTTELQGKKLSTDIKRKWSRDGPFFSHVMIWSFRKISDWVIPSKFGRNSNLHCLVTLLLFITLSPTWRHTYVLTYLGDMTS